MKVLLVVPPSPAGVRANREGFGGFGVLAPGKKGFVYPSLRLAEAAGALRAAGARVLVADHVLAPWRARLSAWRARPDAIVVQASPVSIRVDRAHGDSLSRRFPGVPLTWTGVGLSALGPEWPPEPGQGIHAGPCGSGLVPFVLGVDGQSEASPAWDLLPMGRARRPGLVHVRGCTEGCGYCPYVLATGRRQIVRPLEALARDLEFTATLRPKRLVFRDPNFGAHESSEELLDRLIKRPGRALPFEMEARPEVWPKSRLQRLADAGCVEWKVGIESGAPAALIASGRSSSASAAAALERAADSVRSALALGMTVRAFFLEALGDQDAEQESVRRFAWLAGLDLKPDSSSRLLLAVKPIRRVPDLLAEARAELASCSARSQRSER